MKTILLIEDDPVLNKNIKEALESDGLHVETVYDGLLAERLLKKNRYQCIILDINLPGRNGYDLCQIFRQYDSATPVLMLTAFDEIEDKVKGFSCGADDYLTKPFYMRELLLRIRSLLKRSEGNNLEPAVFQMGDILIDTAHARVSRRGEVISLTPREYQIMFLLVRAQGELVSKKELIREIWGGLIDSNTNTLEVYINFLRNKIDKPFDSQVIRTKIGYGYYLDFS